jgi:hypothetical protein
MGYILLMGLMLLWDADNVYLVRERGYIIMVTGHDDIVMIDMLCYGRYDILDVCLYYRD